ncbi:ABC transporter substrate-binding protein [Frigoriflavimonas asaccharolytica]|uniref:ABC-type Fe3+-hydroxamate transport system substrate-binding protein n=1 Tax=Frigoriflavimonas asaccharolytica TaxID=2735899 RepID=A0A8J8G9V9_9FLAO|nr:helical backbone metal receptor [Frigoriflavimonas asaccharolytica]NRS92607.1 ABC-type Fe3+-hydroxamate transport system substrate-binding protein [Frigoriflavimonas asaccharolytica]
MKIISLVPSITETLFDFGLSKHEIVGRTKFCIHPKKLVSDVAIIGGTKNLNIEKILALKPDLIIANKEENEKLQVQELSKTCRVWVTDIKNIQDNENFLWEMGMVLKKRALAEQFNKEIKSIFSNLINQEKKKIAYLIWQNPMMSIGGDTFINNILEEINFENILKHKTRYPEISLEEIATAEFLFLSSEPFPFAEKHIEEFKSKLPSTKIILVDGEAFSWFGTRILQCETYFKKLQNL